MELKIEWSEPDSVFELRKQYSEKLRVDVWRYATKWTWIFSPLVLLFLYFFGQQAFDNQQSNLYLSSVLVVFLMPSVVLLALKSEKLPKFFYSLRRGKYKISRKGVLISDSSQYIAVSWKRVGIYRFSNHSEISAIRVFEFQTKRMKFESKAEMWFQFPFDPNEVDESEIQAVVETYFVDETQTTKRQDSV